MSIEKYKIVEGQVKVTYELALGRTWSHFYDCFKEGKIMGTRCRKCSRVLVPPRSFCPRCFEDMDEWVEVSDEGIIETWVYVNMPFFAQETKIPFISAQIRLDGCDSGFTHIVGGVDMSDLDKVRAAVKLGGRVKAVWSREKKGSIRDIEYFEPVK
ncbi:MAG: Zn-ribbon domain-containing OB-fold protein [Syntrophales bacterium]|nr:Zn-ribbon domain-containing OB-fold protein [Syntrophales bacterium]MDD5234171.1 Zn-ribbon domain-containing OB-fold protein [Syntrophales bacterium]MDD5531609.1 Zn-ribbon domain-containing OB-fold protein [Syntrophales bacterium]HPL64481.1 Zn-ribbon domain-containing OB-fold protein [Syntrophales bacterium]